MVKKYQKKPVTIEAVQWDGSEASEKEVLDFCGEFAESLWLVDKIRISTLEGNVDASVGDYIIKGVHGEFYPCKPDIFAETYTEVTE